MKKPIQGNGLVFSELLYGNHRNLTTPGPKNNCTAECQRTSPAISEKDGRNMAQACISQGGDSNTAQKIFDDLRGKYCDLCQAKFTRAFWDEMERENEQ